jgi:hypothetical protein
VFCLLSCFVFCWSILPEVGYGRPVWRSLSTIDLAIIAIAVFWSVRCRVNSLCLSVLTEMFLCALPRIKVSLCNALFLQSYSLLWKRVPTMDSYVKVFCEENILWISSLCIFLQSSLIVLLGACSLMLQYTLCLMREIKLYTHTKQQVNLFLCEMWGFHSQDWEEFYLLWCLVVYFDRCLRTFRRKVLQVTFNRNRIHFTNIFQSTIRSSHGIFLQIFRLQCPLIFRSLACYMPCPAYPTFDHPNTISLRIQIKKISKFFKNCFTSFRCLKHTPVADICILILCVLENSCTKPRYAFRLCFNVLQTFAND